MVISAERCTSEQVGGVKWCGAISRRYQAPFARGRANARVPLSGGVDGSAAQRRPNRRGGDASATQPAFRRRLTVSMSITLAPSVAIRASFARASLTSWLLAVE